MRLPARHHLEDTARIAQAIADIERFFKPPALRHAVRIWCSASMDGARQPRGRPIRESNQVLEPHRAACELDPCAFRKPWFAQHGAGVGHTPRSVDPPRTPSARPVRAPTSSVAPPRLTVFVSVRSPVLRPRNRATEASHKRPRRDTPDEPVGPTAGPMPPRPRIVHVPARPSARSSAFSVEKHKAWASRSYHSEPPPESDACADSLSNLG
jgi:hypothetical protein